MLVLGRDDLESLDLTWSQIVDVLEDAFRQKAAGLVQNPPKPAVRPREDAFINAMPAYLGGSDRAGIKWVAGYEQNRAKGLPYIHGVFVLTEADTGRPLALIDGAWITDVRTPGVSGVVMRQLADEPKRLAIVGAGVQGRRHLELLLDLCPGIEQVRAFDTEPQATEALLSQAEDRDRVAAASTEEALDGADLVVTVVTVTLEPRLTAANTDADAVLLPVDYDDALGPPAANDASGRKLRFGLRRVPTDPMTNSTEWGLRSYQDKPDATSWGGQNVFDVYTKSKGTALNGTKYSDW